MKGSEETYDAHLTREVWIESTDFQETDAPGYYGLAPNKLVALRQAQVTPASLEKCLHMCCGGIRLGNSIMTPFL